MKFVETPNLPNGMVTHVIVGLKYERLLQPAFHQLGITLVTAEGKTMLDAPVAEHGDMLCCYLGKGKIVLAKECSRKFKDSLKQLGFVVLIGRETLEKQYPKDILYNAFIMEHTLMHTIKHTDKLILQACEPYQTIDVAQGYTKCSVAVVAKKAVITADVAIAQKLTDYGFDVLCICPGYVSLEGYPYGFIGGACGKIAKDVLAFTGVLNNHPHCHRILDFLKKHHVTPYFLTQKDVFDVGSMIPICEE